MCVTGGFSQIGSHTEITTTNTHSICMAYNTIYYGLHVTSGGEDVTETVHFITMMDKFFDCLNVTGMSCRKKKRKPFQDSYRKTNDFCLKVSNISRNKLKHFICIPCSE